MNRFHWEYIILAMGLVSIGMGMGIVLTTEPPAGLIECGVRAQERGFTHFYLEESDGKITCMGEFRHPINKSLMKMVITQYNKSDNDQAMDAFINSAS
jgi:hypothetical protein